MASEIPENAPPPRGARQRNWHGYDDYRRVHESHIARLIEAGIVTEDLLRFEEETVGGRLTGLVLSGRVVTAGGAVLSVEKDYEVRQRGRGRGRTEVRTREYRYHAWLPGPPARDLFRYDNCHGDLETLHCHRYGPDAGERVEHIPHDALPWLSEVIEEAHRLAESA